MKKYIIILLVPVLCSGCLEAITPQDVVAIDAKVEAVGNSIDAFQGTILESLIAMEKANVIHEGTPEKLADIYKKVDEIQPVVEEAVNNVVSAEYSGDKLLDALKAAEAVNAASSPVNPYAGIIDTGLKGLIGVLAALGIGGTAYAKKVSKENTTMKKGVAKLERESDPELANKIHAAVNSAS